MLVEVLRCIRKCRKDENTAVSFVDGVLDLVRDEAQEFLQLRIVCRGDVRHHFREDGQYFAVLFQLPPP